MSSSVSNEPNTLPNNKTVLKRPISEEDDVPIDPRLKKRPKIETIEID